MKAMRSRKAGAMSLVDAILSHAGKASGLRIEARLRGPFCRKPWRDVGHNIEGVMALLAAKVFQHELAASIDAQTFSWMRGSGPNPENIVQVEAFQRKQRQWAFLQDIWQMGVKNTGS